MIKPMEVGTTAEGLPLHMTFVHWFQSSTAQDRVVSVVSRVLSKQKPLQLVVGEQDLFGENKDVVVNKVDRTKELFMLHKRLVQSLNKISVQHTNDNWVDDGWAPHVTHKTQSKLSPHDEFIVDSVSIVSSDDFKHGQRYLLATISFS
jgi:2'-5' RNA ligase